METYANENENRSHYLTQRGFEIIPKSIERYLRLPIQGIPNYLKLHGSIDWWKRDDGMIVTSNNSNELYGKKLVEHIMIYPTYEKYISLEPFYSLYTAFRNMLRSEQIVVVIGYSFRDISVNNAFKDFLKSNRQARILISVKSDSVEERIKKMFGNHKSVKLLKNHFGEKRFIAELKSALTSK